MKINPHHINLETVNAELARKGATITFTEITDVMNDKELWGEEDGDADTWHISGNCTEDGIPDIPAGFTIRDGKIVEVETY